MDTILNSKKFVVEEEEKKSSRFLNFFKESYYKLYKAFANNKLIGNIKSTIALLLPILILGFIAYYLNDAEVFGPGVTTFKSISSVTIGTYTLYFTVVLTYKNMKDKFTSFPIMLVVLVTNVICVSLISGFVENEDDSNYIFPCGIEYLFVGIFYSWITVKVFAKFINKKKTIYKVYTTEAHKTAVLIAKLLLPLAIMLIPTAMISFALSLTGQDTLMGIIATPFRFMFEHCNIQALNGAIYAFFGNLLSFFGVGLNVNLEGVSETGVLSKNFFVLFVNIPLIAGLVLSILFFGKRRKDKIYGGAAVAPTVLNATNMVYYGIPAYLNPMTLIPCIIIPTITTVISYFLFNAFGIEITSGVNTSLSLIIFNAFNSTSLGSGLAVVVQLISIAISFGIFVPFVLLNNYARTRALKENIKEMYPKYVTAKHKNKHVTIFDFDFELGETAKMLCNQLIKDMKLMEEVRTKVIELNSRKETMKVKEFETLKRNLLNKLKKNLKIKSYFQPLVGGHVEFDENGKPTDFEVRGLECLMRWWYNDSYVIPPLAIEIARQAGLEYEINYYLWENMLINVDRKKCKCYVTFNISMNCLEKDSFIDDITSLFERYDMDPSGFVIEITEEDEFKNEDEALKKIVELKEKGFVFAIDDYGAGQTSMKYFQTNAFELVKIDGDLVKKAKENEQVYDIIGNIKELGKKGQKYANIQFKVLCEFIEDKESFDRLKELKIDYYQGYLFGKAMDFDELVNNENIKLAKGSQKHV